MGLYKVLKIVALVLSLIGVYFFFNLLFKGNDTIVATGEGVDGFLYITYITLALIVALILVFVLKGILSGNVKKTLLVLAVFVAIIVVSYVFADGVETPLKDGGTLSASGSRWVGAGLNMFYILAVLAIGAMVFSGIKKVSS